MKRNDQDYVGRPVARPPRPDCMGLPRLSRPADVASFLDAKGAGRESDVTLVAEFSEFLAGDADPHGSNTIDVDSAFKERLRRKLFRLHLLAQRRPSADPH